MKNRDELEAGLAHIRSAPADHGLLHMIVRRPAISGREVLEEAALDSAEGLVGDTWNRRKSSRTPDGVMPTRNSSVLISLGTPIFIMLPLERLLPRPLVMQSAMILPPYGHKIAKSLTRRRICGRFC